MQTAPGSNLEETGRIMDEIEAAIRDIPQIKIYSRVTGKDAVHNQSASAGSFTIRLKNWSERKEKGDDVSSVMKEIYRRTDGIKAATIRVSTSPMISGYGMSNGFDLYVQDKKGGSVDDLLKYTNGFIDALNKRPGMSREEASTGNTTTLVFIVCIVFIYLILCALYESLMIPFAVILSVPFGLTGSFLFAKLWGLENNIYMQTGLIMLDCSS